MGYRKPRPLNREIKQVRDTRLFIIATEGAKTEKLYFEMKCFQGKKIHIRVISPEQNRSSPRHVLDCLHKYREEYQFIEGDRFWLVIDRDRWDQQNLREIVQNCRESGYQVAISRPCFELWLLLHFKTANDIGTEPTDCSQIKALLESVRRHYAHEDYDTTYAPWIDRAVTEAEKLDRDPNAPIPDEMCTQVYQLVDELKT